MIEPSEPGLFTVNVAPCRSSIDSLPERAFWMMPRSARATPATLNWSASRSTGTISPFSTDTAIPRLYWRCSTT